MIGARIRTGTGDWGCIVEHDEDRAIALRFRNDTGHPIVDTHMLDGTDDVETLPGCGIDCDTVHRLAKWHGTRKTWTPDTDDAVTWLLALTAPHTRAA